MNSVEEKVRKNEDKALAIFKAAIYVVGPLTIVLFLFGDDLVTFISQNIYNGFSKSSLLWSYVILCLLAVKVFTIRAHKNRSNNGQRPS